MVLIRGIYACEGAEATETDWTPLPAPTIMPSSPGPANEPSGMLLLSSRAESPT